MNTCLVRLWHLHQSSRFSRKWNAELVAEFDAHFDYRKVLVAPPGFEQWQATNLASLRLTRASQDLSPEQEVEICRYHNGPWDGVPICHYCLPNCPRGGTRPLARRKTLAAVASSTGPVCPLAVEYRWKRQLEACAVMLRSRLQCDMGPRVLRRIVDVKAVRRAEEEVAALKMPCM